MSKCKNCKILEKKLGKVEFINSEFDKAHSVPYGITEWKKAGEERGYFEYFTSTLQSPSQEWRLHMGEGKVPEWFLSFCSLIQRRTIEEATKGKLMLCGNCGKKIVYDKLK